MPERKERKLTAQLKPESITTLYAHVCRATEGTREDKHCLDAAYTRLSEILGIVYEVSADTAKLKNWDKIVKEGLAQYEFSHAVVIGFKIALVQYLMGQSHPKRLKADVAARMAVMRLAACFSKKFVELINEGCKLEDVKVSEIELEDVFDESESSDLKKVEDESADPEKVEDESAEDVSKTA